MRSRRALSLLSCVAGLALFAAGPATAQRGGSAEDILAKVAGADDAPYRAKQLVVYFGERQSAAVLDVQSSPEGRFVRAESGGDVTRIWTNDEMGLVAGEQVSKLDGALTQVRMRPDGVLAKYSVDAGRPQEMLGVELVPLTLTRRKDTTLAERWWVHEKTGVVYKRELFDASGDLAGLTTLLEMDWGRPGPAEPVEADLRAAPSDDTIEAPGAPRRLAGGYRFLRAYDIEVEQRPAEHWVYTDGLHALSVFRTEGAFAPPEGFTETEVSGEAVWTGPGPGTWAWRGDGHGFLVVAEEPAIEPSELLEPFPRGGPSVLERLGSVWSRLFKAVGRLFD